MDNLKCEFIVSSLNSDLLYCKICNIVIDKNNHMKNELLCSKKLHDAAMDPNNHQIKLVKTEIIDASSLEKPSQSKQECSQEQIDSRMDICKQCPFFQNNSCLQCGCALSRDRNYKNKLYFADQSCPIGKWGPIS